MPLLRMRSSRITKPDNDIHDATVPYNLSSAILALLRGTNNKEIVLPNGFWEIYRKCSLLLSSAPSLLAALIQTFIIRALHRQWHFHDPLAIQNGQYLIVDEVTHIGTSMDRSAAM